MPAVALIGLLFMKLSQITIIEAVEVDFTGINQDIVDRLSPFPSLYNSGQLKRSTRVNMLLAS